MAQTIETTYGDLTIEYSADSVETTPSSGLAAIEGKLNEICNVPSITITAIRYITYQSYEQVFTDSDLQLIKLGIINMSIDAVRSIIENSPEPELVFTDDVATATWTTSIFGHDETLQLIIAKAGSCEDVDNTRALALKVSNIEHDMKVAWWRTEFAHNPMKPIPRWLMVVPTYADGKDITDIESALLSGDLSGADLRGINFGGYELGGMNFSGANLRCANLADSNLRGATFIGANLNGANLTATNLSGAKFVDATMRGAVLWAANICGAKFVSANLHRADLSDVTVDAATLFKDCDLTYSKFCNVDMKEIMKAGYFGCVYHYAGGVNSIRDPEYYNIRKIREFWKNNVVGIDMSGADLTGAAFSISGNGINLSHSKFIGAIMTDITTMTVNFSCANFSDAKISCKSAIGRVNLTYTKFTGADISDVKFDTCDFTGADFSGATLRSVEFKLSNMTGVKFADSKLSQTRFEHVAVSRTYDPVTDFSGADLSGRPLKIISGESLQSDDEVPASKFRQF
jgi:uncharacterized protein YjbI with pentapeptide repeats